MTSRIFCPQATAYVNPADRRFGLLVVLDASVENDPGVLLRTTSSFTKEFRRQGLPLLVGIE
jgi:hypothetical protein